MSNFLLSIIVWRERERRRREKEQRSLMTSATKMTSSERERRKRKREMVDYRKWDSMTFSSDEEDEGNTNTQSTPKNLKTPPPSIPSPPPTPSSSSSSPSPFLPTSSYDLGPSHYGMDPLTGNAQLLLSLLREKEGGRERLKKLLEEQRRLLELLGTLPLKRKHAIMVPLGQGSLSHHSFRPLFYLSSSLSLSLFLFSFLLSLSLSQVSPSSLAISPTRMRYSSIWAKTTLRNERLPNPSTFCHAERH